VSDARQSLLKTFRADPAKWTVTFTSGGTEANQLAIRGVLTLALEAHREGKGPAPIWYVSPTEHACVLDLIEPMKRLGVDVRVLRVKPDGEVELPSEADHKAILVSVIGVNNETGRRTSHILRGKNSFPTTCLTT